MNYDFNDPKVIEAWRIVSEALLRHLQQGGNLSTVDTLGGFIPETVAKATTTESGSVQPPVCAPASTPTPPAKGVPEERYATCPMRTQDGYIFKNLKAEVQEESTYKIYRYADGTCEFELCELKGEALQIFKDNRDTRMPNSVGVSTGAITQSVTTTKRGKGFADGRTIKITEPLVAVFS